MLEAEKQRSLVEHLAESASDFEKLVRSVDASLWTTRPEPDRWSVSEIAEHVLIIDGRVAALIGTLGELPEEAYDVEHCARKDELITRIAERPSAKISAPDAVQPTGILRSVNDFAPKFRSTQEILTRAASGDKTLLRGRFREHPILKKLDGYQWLLVTSCHRRRHMHQIEDVKNALLNNR